MAVDVALNTPEVWRSVVGYVKRKSNPAYHWRDNGDVHPYLDEWDDEVHYDVRGPYTEESAARVQAGRDASARTKPEWRQHITSRVVSVTVECSSLAWQECSRRDPESKKWEDVE